MEVIIKAEVGERSTPLPGGSLLRSLYVVSQVGEQTDEAEVAEGIEHETERE